MQEIFTNAVILSGKTDKLDNSAVSLNASANTSSEMSNEFLLLDPTEDETSTVASGEVQALHYLQEQ